MTADDKILWAKIEAFKFDDENASFKFSGRLARENGWSIAYAKLVMEEYKKFIFLCCVSAGGVTPSDEVDQVWHLHLTYTKSYWTDLCKNTLSKEIHHNPTKGGKAEGDKFDDFYTETLKLYKEKFNTDAPKNIWPDNETRFSNINFQRVNLKNYWLVRRPYLTKKTFFVYLVIFISFFFIQASSDGTAIGVFVIVLIMIGVLVSIFKKGGGNNGGSGGCSGGSGCSGSGCSHGHSDSGCSGCSGGGCSGCGGGGD